MRVRLLSSSICETMYHPANKILEVIFHSGHVYRYSGVPHEIFDQFVAAESAGKFYNSQIKGKFNSMRWL